MIGSLNNSRKKPIDLARGQKQKRKALFKRLKTCSPVEKTS